jgi:hypothetical protein
MQTVVTAPDTIAALGKLTAALGPDAVLLRTRRTRGGGIEMTGRATPPPPAEAARGRFLSQAAKLGFDRAALEAVLADIPTDGDAADLWVRFVSGLERRLKFAPPPQAGHLAVAGAPGSGRTTALVQLAMLHKRAGLDAALVEADPDRAAAGKLERAAQVAGLPYLMPGKGGLDALIARQGRKARLLIDLPDGAARPSADVSTLLCAARGASAVPEDVGAAAVIVTRFDEPGAPGALLSTLLELDLPIAFFSRSRFADGAFEAARAVPLCRLVVSALAALGSPS